jgi:hypothetical protein
MPYLALFRQLKGPLSPSTFGKMLLSGISTLSIKIIPVVDALNENFP